MSDASRTEQLKRLMMEHVREIAGDMGLPVCERSWEQAFEEWIKSEQPSQHQNWSHK